MILLTRTSFYTALISIGSLFSLASAKAQVPDVAGIPDQKKEAEAIYVDAVKARMLDDSQQEEELLNRVIKQNPDQGAPYYDLARLYQKQKKYPEAEQLMKKAVERNKENPWYKAAYASILESESKTEEAAAIYKELAGTEKYNKEYIYNAGRLYESAGKYKEAITLYDQLLSKIDDQEIVLLQEQQLYLKLNDLDNAVKVAQKLIDQNQNEARYLANLASLYENNGHPEKSLAIYEKALKDFPNDPNIQYGLAEYYQKKKDSVKYHEYIKKAILNPDFDDEVQTSILFNYLQDLADSSQKQESIDITRQLAEQHPENAQIISLYGEVLLSNGAPEKATEQFKKAITIDPSRFVVWQRLLFCYADPKDADSLIKYSEKAMRFFPNQAVVHYLNGVGHFNKKDYKSAIKAINRAIDMQPEDNPPLLADMYALLGDVHNAAAEYVASDSSYEKALRLNPKNASALNNYAYYLSVRGDRLADAEKMSKKSLDLKPDEATFLDTYGWILYKEGNYQKAKEYIGKALEQNPAGDGTVYEHLGDVYYKLNDQQKAVEYWKKAKQKGTENKLIDKKIQDQKLYE
jgi:tetratricopeptide (TPR) repeat protein